MFCSTCGYKLGTIAKFCGNCGNLVKRINYNAVAPDIQEQPSFPSVELNGIMEFEHSPKIFYDQLLFSAISAISAFILFFILKNFILENDVLDILPRPSLIDNTYEIVYNIVESILYLLLGFMLLFAALNFYKAFNLKLAKLSVCNDVISGNGISSLFFSKSFQINYGNIWNVRLKSTIFQQEKYLTIQTSNSSFDLYVDNAFAAYNLVNAQIIKHRNQ